MKCDGYRILIQEMLEGHLDIDEATVVVVHMNACEACRSFHRETLANKRSNGEHIVETVGPPEKPPVAWYDALPVVIAVILAALFLGGFILIATHAGWFQPERSSCNAGHYSTVPERSH